jgi:hypothetical protein
VTGYRRRDVLHGSVGLAGAVAVASAAPAVSALAPRLRERLRDDMQTYAGFGSKNSGSPGDLAAAKWIGDRLSTAGFKARQADFPVPMFRTDTATLRVGADIVAVMPQPIVVPTPASGITAAVRLVRDETEAPAVKGRIAAIVLPYGRHAAIFSGAVKPLLDEVTRHRPLAILIVTTGPTGEIIALNTRLTPMADVPIALLAPRDLPMLSKAAALRSPVTLTVTGTSLSGTSCNIIATRSAGPRWLAFSTPRSGWGVCAGERGPGTAAFLELCDWAAMRFPQHSLFAINNGGHELDFVGAHHALSEGPPPGQTQIWTHLGAGLATRDAFEVLGRNHELLSSADPQRVTMASPTVFPQVQEAFRDLAGYEKPIKVVSGAGELSSIIERGYANAFAGLGIHRWCHVADDTIDKVDAALLEPVVEAHRSVIEAVVARIP